MGPAKDPLDVDDDASDVVTLEDVVNAACPEHEWQCSRVRARPDRAEALVVCRTCTAGPEGPANEERTPIIVCQACAEACHAEHDTFALGNRHRLQCQCSPPHCALSDATGVQVPASQLLWLREHHNARNRFCVCDTEYTGEEDGVMYQCIGCEDWFHLRCLAGLEQAEARPGELLVCTACMSGDGALAQWARVAALEGSQAQPFCFAKMPQVTTGTTSSSRGVPTLIHVDQLGTAICSCESCAPFREDAHLDWVLDDENAAVGGAETEPTPFPPSVQGNRMLELEYAHTWQAAKQRLYSLFRECARENRVVTERDVRLALADIQREIGQTR
ncbi:hypothetical protein CCYA_CCYA04G1204 [Cyanidiococcus yangmingshanensis]|nr:hypothetical protein CCYA_CCYA04G1204 [Cyanidiococcus yangmingshanensis]